MFWENLVQTLHKCGDILRGGLKILLISILTPNLVIHELGHFAASLLTGVHVDAVDVGEGDALWSFSLRKIPVTIREIPIGGGILVNSDKVHARWQIIIVLMAGCLANLVVAIICILTNHPLGWVYGVINLLFCCFSLLPTEGSDGYLCFMLLRGKVPEGMTTAKEDD